MDVEEQVGTSHAYRGTTPLGVIEMVHDAILDSICYEFGMGEILAVHRRVYGECGVGSHVFPPVDLADYIVAFVGIMSGELLDGLENPEGRAATQIGFVHHFEIPLEADHAASHLHVFRAERNKLVAEHILKALEGLGNH